MIIAEALLLLALDDETGKRDLMVDPPESRLADAVMVELALLGRIALPAGASDAAAPLALFDPTLTGHPELDAALAVVGAGAVTSAEAGAQLAPGLRDRLGTVLLDGAEPDPRDVSSRRPGWSPARRG